MYDVDALLVVPDHSCPGSGQQPGLQPASSSLNASRSGAWPACSGTCVSGAGLSLLISAAEARSGPSQDHRVFPGGRPAHTALGSIGLSSSLHTVITDFNYSHHATLQLTHLGLLKLWNSPPPQAPAHTSWSLFHANTNNSENGQKGRGCWCEWAASEPRQSRWRDGDEPVGGGDAGNTETRPRQLGRGREKERLFPWGQAGPQQEARRSWPARRPSREAQEWPAQEPGPRRLPQR